VHCAAFSSVGFINGRGSGIACCKVVFFGFSCPGFTSLDVFHSGLTSSSLREEAVVVWATGLFVAFHKRRCLWDRPMSFSRFLLDKAFCGERDGPFLLSVCAWENVRRFFLFCSKGKREANPFVRSVPGLFFLHFILLILLVSETNPLE